MTVAAAMAAGVACAGDSSPHGIPCELVRERVDPVRVVWASETMSELGERGACNDHAIRDSVIDLPFMGTREIGNTGFRFVQLDLVTSGYVTLDRSGSVPT